MKLIIDIPDKYYKNDNLIHFFGCYSKKLDEVIKNGIPLEDIKAEITNIPITDTDGHNNNWYREPQAIIDDVIEIINKHISGKENE